MAFDDLKAELALLINQMENQPEDRTSFTNKSARS